MRRVKARRLGSHGRARRATAVVLGVTRGSRGYLWAAVLGAGVVRWTQKSLLFILWSKSNMAQDMTPCDPGGNPRGGGAPSSVDVGDSQGWTISPAASCMNGILCIVVNSNCTFVKLLYLSPETTQLHNISVLIYTFV